MTKTKIALAALLVAGTASAAMAQGEFDPNPANRYPAYAAPAYAAPGATLRTAPVQLNQGRNVGATHDQFQNNWVPAPAHAGGVG
jgi:hypothetical protein